MTLVCLRFKDRQIREQTFENKLDREILPSFSSSSDSCFVSKFLTTRHSVKDANPQKGYASDVIENPHGSSSESSNLSRMLPGGSSKLGCLWMVCVCMNFRFGGDLKISVTKAYGKVGFRASYFLSYMYVSLLVPRQVMDVRGQDVIGKWSSYEWVSLDVFHE